MGTNALRKILTLMQRRNVAQPIEHESKPSHRTWYRRLLNGASSTNRLMAIAHTAGRHGGMLRRRDVVGESTVGIAKCPSGIDGLDEITGGGLPRGRPTLLCGNAGCGKTLLSAEFLVRGATRYNEPGVFVTFEETATELADNVASLGFDLNGLSRSRKLYIDHVQIERGEIEEAGEFDLDGLFVRLGHAIDSLGAKRVALDTLESLFSSLPNETIVRAELRRLFRWLKEKDVTAIITAERGDGATLTRQGLEEYVSDCVILLDHRVTDQISTRRLRIVKYRGSLHGTNEYPFLIDDLGIAIVPITSIGLSYEASSDRVSSGLSALDAMLDGHGFYRGSSILISGTGGTGKTSLAALFGDAACRRRERVLYFAFEESPSQICRNMQSIGLDLHRRAKSGLLKFHAARATSFGLETHLATMHRLVDQFTPAAVIFDPISSLTSAGTMSDVYSAVMRLLDYVKSRQITVLCTSLGQRDASVEPTQTGIASLTDTWILVKNVEANGERSRQMCVLKSRGMAHSHESRGFEIASNGICVH
jgi:circadian clock protein KaiC